MVDFLIFYKIMKQRIFAILLCFFLGPIGAHKFYLNQNKKGLLILILTLTGIGLVISLPWVVIDFFKLILMSDEKFNEIYNS